MSMSDMDLVEQDIPLFRLAFRPFFLFGTLFTVAAMMIWLATLNGWWQKDLYGGGFFWHVHEMIFGFVVAIIVGFLLTAVQNWTGVHSISGIPLAILFFLWLGGRLGFLVIDTGNLWLATLDISFLLVAAVFLAIPILSVRQWRNLFFVPVLLLFVIANAMMHLGVLNQDHDLVIQGTRTALFLVCVLMVTIGGRVIPFFTANATGAARATPIMIVEWVSLGAVWLLMIVFLLGLNELIDDLLIAGLLLVAAIFNLIRLLRWKFQVTLNNPMLWTLHLAYLFIVAGLAVLAASFAGVIVPSIGWHVLTVGGMGGLILSMVSRVSLGHTGRKILAPGWLPPAFVCVFAAALVRSLLVWGLGGYYMVWITLSGVLWIVAFGIFVVGYFSVLTRPRPDNRPG
ncbi:MAG: NnrS family protein [Pseudomonadales bacterium]|nr:NnrS family protein [Pseudomonadales bacterium]